MLFLSILDSAGVPLIGIVDGLLIFLAIHRPPQAFFGASLASLGSLIGCSLLFAIARKGGHTLLARYTESRRGKRLRNWFERYGLFTVFVPAVSPIPLPMKIPLFCAGALEVRWSYFLPVMLSARLLRYFALAYLGMSFGPQTIPFLKQHWPAVILTVVALGACSVLFLRLADRKRLL